MKQEKILKQIDDMCQMISDLQERINFLEANEELFVQCPFEIVFSATYPRIAITDIKQLSAAGDFMYKLIGIQTFYHELSFYSYRDHCIAVFMNDRTPWAIWLECPIEDFPSNLLPLKEVE